MLGALLVTALLSGPPAGAQLPGAAAAADAESITPDVFIAAGERTKGALLMTAAQSAPIASLTALIRLGLRDSDAAVRALALDAVSCRAAVSSWAGTSGPTISPAPPGMARPRPAPRVIPPEWRGDRRRLFDAVGAQLVRLFRSDREARVRRSALMALGHLHRPDSPDGLYPASFVDLMTAVYRADPDASVRAEVVKTLGLIPNETPATRAVLRDALVDVSSAVQHVAQAAIRAPRLKLSFADAEPALKAALTSSSVASRVGAVRALNIFGRAAAGYLDVLAEMERNDAASDVRTAAGLAIKSITGQPGEVW